MDAPMSIQEERVFISPRKRSQSKYGKEVAEAEGRERWEGGGGVLATRRDTVPPQNLQGRYRHPLFAFVVIISSRDREGRIESMYRTEKDPSRSFGFEDPILQIGTDRAFLV